MALSHLEHETLDNTSTRWFVCSFEEFRPLRHPSVVDLAERRSSLAIRVSADLVATYSYVYGLQLVCRGRKMLARLRCRVGVGVTKKPDAHDDGREDQPSYRVSLEPFVSVRVVFEFHSWALTASYAMIQKYDCALYATSKQSVQTLESGLSMQCAREWGICAHE